MDRLRILQLHAGLVNGSPGTESQRLYHAVTDRNVALCGTRPGLWSRTWAPRPGDRVTCSACLEALARRRREARP